MINDNFIKLISIFLKYKKKFISLLAIFVCFFLIQVFNLPVNSQILSPQQLGEIITETEQSWEKEYEAYFDTDFTNYSKTKTQIAKQLNRLSQETSSRVRMDCPMNFPFIRSWFTLP